jgi:hypothetical protein
MDGESSAHGEDEKCVKNLIGEPERRRPRSRWEYNIKIYQKEIECDGVYQIHLPWVRDRWRALANKVLNLLIP